MKTRKIILMILAVFAFGFVNAQEQTAKGKWLIEANTGNAMLGSTGFSFSSSDGSNQYNLGLDGGYFVADNLALKAGLGFGGYKDDFDDSTIFSYRLGAKYYVKGMIPLTLDLTGASIKDSVENPMWLGIGAGYAIFLGSNVSIEPGVRYNHSLNEDYSDKGIFQVNVGFALHF